jgi:hypothetical protein
MNKATSCLKLLFTVHLFHKVYVSVKVDVLERSVRVPHADLALARELNARPALSYSFNG